MKIGSENVTREILKRKGLRLKKALGQNFLIHEPTLNEIIAAAELEAGDLVVEIGPGIGSLTQQLAETGAQVIAIELDQRLIPTLEENLQQYKNVKFIQGDALKLNFDQIVAEHSDGVFGQGKKAYKVVANLPYYITTPIIMHLLESKFNLSQIIVMIQKEVAERLAAKPGGKDYGAITVVTQYYSTAEIITLVPPGAFIPPPGVTSAVISLKSREEPPVDLVSESLFFRVIKGAFGQRRKTLLNALSNSGLGFSKEELEVALGNLNIEGIRRGETLDIGEFAKIANYLAACKN